MIIRAANRATGGSSTAVLRGISLCFVALALSGLQAVAASLGYVANFGDDTVSVIDTVTNTSVATIPVGNGPSAVAVTPDGAHVYVLNAFDNTVSVIATATNTVVGSPIPVGPSIGPTSNVSVLITGGIAITPSGNSVYVVNSGGNTVSVIGTASNTVVDTIPVGLEPTGIAITPDGTHVYVTNLEDNTVSVIATTTNMVVGSPIPVGRLPFGLAITPDGKHAYIANISDGIDVIEIATNTVVDTIFVDVPEAIAITPDGAHVYTLSNNPTLDNHVDETVTVIDAATNTVVGSPIAIGPAVPIVVFTIAVTPDGTGVYVPNTSAKSVSVISTASNTVTGSVAVGNFPFAVALTPTIVFPAFSAKLDISPNGFDLTGSFTLGARGTINPPTQPLTLKVGTYTVTVPAGSFKAGSHGTFTFAGTIGGVALQIRIAPLGGRSYQIQLEASGIDLTGLSNPVAVDLSIGNNTGTASVSTHSN